MSKIKMIGLDLDRTTLNNNGKISEITKEILEKAHDIGVHIVIATGRAFHSMPRDIYELAGVEYTVNSNGAEIRTLDNKETIYRNCIDEEKISEVCDLLQKKKFMIEAFVDGQAYIEREEFENIRDYKKVFRAREYVLNTRKPIENIFEFISANKNIIENINVFFESDREKTEMWRKLERIQDITVTSSMPDNLEIGGKTTSKSEALLYLAQKLDIKKEEIMCCGDSLNDLKMLQMAGVSVAMENACDEIKEIADYITATNEENGVAKAIEKFVLK